MAEVTTALVLTVGTGNERDLEGSILSPFRKSIGDGHWQHIVLLPSQSTIRLAEMVRDDHPALAAAIRIIPLPEPNDEYNLDRSFAHFQQILFGLIDSGCTPDSMTVDLTRGTKAMSAALALAAVSIGIHSIRYIEGTAKDHAGMTIAGTERVSDITAVTVSRSNTLSLAESFLTQGQFSASTTLLDSDPELRRHPQYGPAARWLSWAARFWGSWDHLHYPAAEECLGSLHDPEPVPASLRQYLPTDLQCQLLSTLGLDNPPDPAAHLPLCRALTADLLANARRRLAQGQTEEALVRVGRVVELLGQTRLFEHGYYSSSVPSDDPRVKTWINQQEKKNKFVEARDGRYVLARQNVGSLLKHLGDQMAPKLNKLDSWLSEFDIELRNHSVLIHGFLARSRGLAGKIEQWIANLEKFHVAEHPRNAALLAAARFPFFPSC